MSVSDLIAVLSALPGHYPVRLQHTGTEFFPDVINAEVDKTEHSRPAVVIVVNGVWNESLDEILNEDYATDEEE